MGDRVGGLIQRIPSTPTGYDLKGLSTLMQQVKARFPQATAATVLAQPDTSYDVLVQVMDAVRETQTISGQKVAHVELFPDISIGDAPVARK